jgi:hypothetical protein
MSLDVQTKTTIKQLKTGIHLVTIIDAELVKDKDKNIIKTPDGEIGILITFADGKNNKFQNAYWITPPKYEGKKDWIFLKMTSAANININNTKFKAESKGKRLWIYIKEVHSINLDEPVCDELTGEPIINYYIFAYGACSDESIKPSMMGNPQTNGGIAAGSFLDYNQITETSSKKELIAKQQKSVMQPSDEFDLPEQPELFTQRMSIDRQPTIVGKVIDDEFDLEPLPTLKDAPKEQRIAKAKEIIGSAKPKMFDENGNYALDKITVPDENGELNQEVELDL